MADLLAVSTPREAPSVASPRRSLAPADGWTFGAAPPPGWAEAVARCGGGFFHTPPVLATSLPAGEPLFAALWRGGRVAAVAAGVVTRCRLSRAARHVRLAAPPAVAPGEDADGALDGLAAALAARGAAETAVDSFDAGRVAAPRTASAAGRERREHVADLLADAEAQLAGFCGNHRRHARRGERAGWTVDAIHGTAALDTLGAVVGTASGRAARRGDPYAPVVPDGLAALPVATPEGAPWGAAVFAARDGDTLLGAALVGWGGERGYYLIGGSTPAGYRAASAVWLHWRVMARLAATGHTVYNLGGTAPGAEAPGHPGHGLLGFKAGFGTRPLDCRGARWAHAPLHLRLHRLLARAAG